MSNKIAVSGKLTIVETIRGLAALAVCLAHLQAANIKYTGTSLFFRSAFSEGYLGVNAFFVLSGFIIPYSLIKARYKITDFFRFFLKRCIRIETPYIASIILVIVLSYLASKAPNFMGAPFAVTWQQVLLHLGYLPKHFGYEWLQDPYWTLEAEFHYYILIGILLPFIWKNEWLFIIGMCVGLATTFYSTLKVFEYMPFFVFGIATCAYKLKRIHQISFVGLLFAAFFVCFLKGFPMSMAYVALLTSLLICYGSFESVVTNFLGKISFSLYLLHVPIGDKMLNLLGRYVHASWQMWLAYITALGTCILAAYFFNRLIELPSIRLSKNILYKSQKKESPHFA